MIADCLDVTALVGRLAFMMAPDVAGLWLASSEARRVERLADCTPEEYGGLERLCAAIATCVADFERRMMAEKLNGLRGGAQEKAPLPSAPSAPPGLGYRSCSVCRGSLREGRGEPCRCTKYGGRPGLELFAMVER